MSCAEPSLSCGEPVEAVGIEIAGVGEAGERRVDLRDRARDGHAAGVVVADAGAGGHVIVPLVTVSVVVSAELSGSATDTPAIGSGVSFDALRRPAPC